MKGKWKGKGKLSDPSPFINILNDIQFLFVLVGIKHSYGGVGVLVSLCVWKEKWKEVKGNERKMKESVREMKMKRNKRKMKERNENGRERGN